MHTLTLLSSTVLASILLRSHARIRAGKGSIYKVFGTITLFDEASLTVNIDRPRTCEMRLLGIQNHRKRCVRVCGYEITARGGTDVAGQSTPVVRFMHQMCFVYVYANELSLDAMGIAYSGRPRSGFRASPDRQKSSDRARLLDRIGNALIGVNEYTHQPECTRPNCMSV